MGMSRSDSRPVVDTGSSGGAKQSFKDECDINNIMKKYVNTGQVTHVARNRGRYADVSELSSYQEAIHAVRETSSFFLGLTPEVRAEFDNDPAVFMDFITDPANIDEIVRLGLEEVVTPSREAAPALEDVPEAVPEVEPAGPASEG